MAPVIASQVIQHTKMEELQTAVSALLGLVSVAIDMAWRTDGNCWMTGCFCIHPKYIEHLWFQQKQVERLTIISVTVRSMTGWGLLH